MPQPDDIGQQVTAKIVMSLIPTFAEGREAWLRCSDLAFELYMLHESTEMVRAGLSSAEIERALNTIGRELAERVRGVADKFIAELSWWAG